VENELKQISIPVVKFKDFQFPYRRVVEEELVMLSEDTKEINPIDILKEMRAHRRELSDQISLVFAVLSRIDNPDVKELLGSLGLIISDVHKRQFYPTEETPEVQEPAQSN